MAIKFNHKPGLVVYLTAGDPSLDATRAIVLAAIDAGADVIELGVPFSDPLADGPVIQRAMERAVALSQSDSSLWSHPLCRRCRCGWG
jgi:tryptophan synthase alpha chain